MVLAVFGICVLATAHAIRRFRLLLFSSSHLKVTRLGESILIERSASISTFNLGDIFASI
jgi:hypothetical protein